MRNTNLITVVIPVYNTEAYVEDCIQSVLSQTYSNLEIIIINDGSTDRSADICRRYEDNERVLFIDRENRGLSKTRQQGFDLAHGEYVCTLDADDKWDEKFVEHMLECIKKWGADICVCGRIDFNEIEQKVQLLQADQSFYETTKQYVTDNIKKLSSDLWLPDSWNKLYRTDFIRKTQVQFFLDNRYNGTDLVFNYLLLLHCPKYCVCHEALLLHRYVANSRVHKNNKPLQQGFEIIESKICDESKRLGYNNYSFMKGFVQMHFRWHCMILNTIISECKSRKELKERYIQFFSEKSRFENRMGFDIYEYLYEGKSLSYSRFLHECVRNKKIYYALFLYEYNRFAQRMKHRCSPHLPGVKVAPPSCK